MDEKMRVAIGSSSDKTEAMVSEVGARAPYYMIFEGKILVKVIKNPFQFGGGVGFSVVQMLYNENVGLVIVGKIGAHMITALEEKGIKYKIIKDKTVKEIIEGL